MTFTDRQAQLREVLVGWGFPSDRLRLDRIDFLGWTDTEVYADSDYAIHARMGVCYLARLESNYPFATPYPCWIATVDFDTLGRHVTVDAPEKMPPLYQRKHFPALFLVRTTNEIVGGAG